MTNSATYLIVKVRRSPWRADTAVSPFLLMLVVDLRLVVNIFSSRIGKAQIARHLIAIHIQHDIVQVFEHGLRGVLINVGRRLRVVRDGRRKK